MRIDLPMITTPDTVDPATVARKAEKVIFESFWLPTAPSPCLLRPFDCAQDRPLPQGEREPITGAQDTCMETGEEHGTSQPTSIRQRYRRFLCR